MINNGASFAFGRLTTALATAIVAIGAANLSGCVRSSTSHGLQKSTYSVYEIEVHRSFETAGQKYRIAVVDAPILDAESGEVWFDGTQIIRPTNFSTAPLGSDGLADLVRRQLVVGKTLNLTATSRTLGSVFSYKPVELSSLAGEPATYNLKLMKRCDVRVERDQYSKITWGGSAVIAVPSRKTHERISIAKPTCFNPSDRTLELGKVVATDPAIKQQIALAKANSEARLAKQARSRAKNELFRRLTEEKVNQARQLAKQTSWTAVTNSSFEDQLRNSICPETVALARVSSIRAVTADRVEIERIVKNESTSVRFETSITIEFEDGRKEKITVALGKLMIADGLKSIRLRADGCVDIDARNNRGHPDSDIVRDISEVLKNHFKREIERDTYQKALAQFPGD